MQPQIVFLLTFICDLVTNGVRTCDSFFGLTWHITSCVIDWERSPFQSSPGSSIGIIGLLKTESWAISLAGHGRELDTVAPDALMILLVHCSVDRWQSPGGWCHVGRPPAADSGWCTAVPLLFTGSTWPATLWILTVHEDSMNGCPSSNLT